MTKEGFVKSSLGDGVFEIGCSSDACSSCKSKLFCNAKSLSFEALDSGNISPKEGDKVKLELPAGRTMLSTAVLFLVPLASWLAGFLVSSLLLSLSEKLSVLIAFGALVISLIVIAAVNSAHKRSNMPLITGILAVLLLVSCGEAEIEQTDPPDLPDIVLTDVDYTLAQKGSKPIIVHAERMEMKNRSSDAVLFNVAFSQNGENGTLFISGTAGEAHVNIDTNDASVSNGVRIVKADDGTIIEGDDIIWNQKNKKLESSGTVRIIYDNSVVVGERFVGDLQSAVFEFRKIKEGSITN